MGVAGLVLLDRAELVDDGDQVEAGQQVTDDRQRAEELLQTRGPVAQFGGRQHAPHRARPDAPHTRVITTRPDQEVTPSAHRMDARSTGELCRANPAPTPSSCQYDTYRVACHLDVEISRRSGDTGLAAKARL